MLVRLLTALYQKGPPRPISRPPSSKLSTTPGGSRDAANDLRWRFSWVAPLFLFILFGWLAGRYALPTRKKRDGIYSGGFRAIRTPANRDAIGAKLRHGLLKLISSFF